MLTTKLLCIIVACKNSYLIALQAIKSTHLQLKHKRKRLQEVVLQYNDQMKILICSIQVKTTKSNGDSF